MHILGRMLKKRAEQFGNNEEPVDNEITELTLWNPEEEE